MVFNKIKDMINGNDEKYEVLYYKYSQIKLQNQKLKEKHEQEMRDYKANLQYEMAKHTIRMFDAMQVAKASSFKVKAQDKDLQRLLMDVNKAEKEIKKTMEDFSIEEVEAKDRFFDPEIHDIASYEDAKGMAKGLIIKTAKKGYRYKGKIIVKPKVVVTK